MRAEVAARETWVDILCTTLEGAENKEWEDLIGFECKLPPLPKRPQLKQAIFILVCWSIINFILGDNPLPRSYRT